MENKYTLHIYSLAQSDFEGIFRYISNELHNPIAAANMIDAFMEALELVCQNPRSCPLVSSRLIKDQTLRKLVVKNYIVFYRPVDISREIQVVRVLYGMRDYEKIL